MSDKYWIIVEIKNTKSIISPMDYPSAMVSHFFYSIKEDAEQDLEFIRKMNPDLSFKLAEVKLT